MTEQLRLNFEPGLTRKHRDLHACVSACVYRYGLENAARDMDMAPSNLATACGGGNRKIGLDEFERFLKRTGDLEPLYYLVEQFLAAQRDPDALMESVQAQFVQLQQTMGQLLAMKEAK